MTAFETASCLPDRPTLGDSGKAALGGRFADRERRYLVVNGQAAFGYECGDSCR